MSGAPAGLGGAPLPRPPRRRGGPALLALPGLVIASFWSLDLRWKELAAPDALSKMVEFVTGFVPPEHAPAFLLRTAWAAFETLAMSALGTFLAALAGLALALPAASRRAAPRRLARGLLNALRAVPELVWASMLVIAAGLGPLPGTLALAAHTTGVLGRLYAETLENLPEGPIRALRDNGARPAAVFLYATLPLALAQFVSYALYRWENNIRAAAVLGVVGAGGLGQMLHYHLGLFQMHETATVILAMLAIVAAVDGSSWVVRRRLAG